MSHNLNDLNIHSPFFMDEFCKESPYVKVDQLKALRLTTSSDIDCTLEIIFSVDTVVEGPKNSFRVSSVWSTRKVDIILPYMKIKLYKLNILDENKHLCINFLSHNNMDTDESNADDEASSEIESKSRSLFSSIMKRRSRNERNEKAESKMDNQNKLPNLIPRNSLLVGGYNNSVLTIPPPLEPNMILMFNGQKLEWINILSIVGEKSINLCNLN